MDVTHACCCCLRRAPDKDLTTPYTQLGITEIYSDMLEQCFDIHMLEGSGSRGICWKCVGRLRDASDFKRQVQRCQAKLLTWLKGENRVKEEEPAVEPELQDGDGASEDPVLWEEHAVKSEMPYEDLPEDRPDEMLQEEPAVEPELQDGDGASEEPVLWEESEVPYEDLPEDQPDEMLYEMLGAEVEDGDRAGGSTELMPGGDNDVQIAETFKSVGKFPSKLSRTFQNLEI